MGTEKMEKSKATHARILEAASKLFYENGYSKTSFDQIAAECGITKPLITYHFGAKSALGGEVYSTTLSRFSNLYIIKAQAAMPDVDVIASSIACTKAYAEYYKQDERARRFYLELLQAASIEELGDLEHLYQSAHGLMDRSFGDDRVRMIYVASNYALHGLIKHYLMGEFEGSQDEFLRFFVDVWLGYFEPTVEEKAQLLGEAAAVIERVHVRYGPRFTFTIES